ncbi:hypothetical protein H3N56_02575 [Cetobacterium sp. 2A]|uniref:hypothetical protein n=1 Tax=Cetobacterium sp. 2A TaxID=2754723 RepID=UPI00163C86B5|nr:hypothetical protein [Cetobacterium sp. 2A]MBC2855378.1 hypothetical protein [Cetobacterium sp. 2A]
MEKELRCEKCLKLLGKFNEKGELVITKPKGIVKLGKEGQNILECLCGKKMNIKL